MSLLSKITGRQHHFKVVLKYFPDQTMAHTFVERRLNVWVADRRNIANDRMIRKEIGPEMVSQVPKHLKRNGKLEVSEVYYLGWFRPVEKQEKPERKLTPKLSQVIELMAVYIGKRT